MLTGFLIVYLSILFVAALPRWSYNRDWGYYPCSAIMVVLGIVLGIGLTTS
jgi:hypothetical protein